ncbi:MAG TPA: class I SAM-dependent methyltransferase, partial [Solirubrobacteraceae bacterium]
MPCLDEIRAKWGAPGGWASGGDEWSGPWGGSEAQWRAALLPRIRSFVPTGTILELGPGQGRWSRHLAGLCEELVLVDVAGFALEACRRRLAGVAHARFHVGDGRSLPMVADGSVDLAFSFDSLVHAEADVLEAYAHELATKLAPDGVALLHHSNMGAYRRGARLARALPERPRRALTRRGLLPSVYGWRAESTTAAWFARTCERAGLDVVGQELISWEYGPFLTDAITLVTPRRSPPRSRPIVVRNRRFIEGTRSGAAPAPLYAAARR